MTDKLAEKNCLIALVKSLPATAPARTKHALEIALMRFDLACNKDEQTDHLTAEIERLVADALAKTQKKQTSHQMAMLPDKEKMPPIQPAPEEPKQKGLVIPETFPDWHFIPLSAKEATTIGEPIKFDSTRSSVPGEIHDKYLLDGDKKFERTPLLINGLLIDAGDWAATFDALDFVKSFTPEYTPFLQNVFLARLTLLTKMEATTRKTVNDFRRNRAAVVSRWTTAMTLFLQGVETGLAGNDLLLAHARVMVNRLALGRLFDLKNGHITFRAIADTDEKIAAECRLIKILSEDTRAKSTADDLSLLRTLRANLRLPASVCEDVDAHVAKVSRMTERAPCQIRLPRKIMAEDVMSQLINDPLYRLINIQLTELPEKLRNNPFVLHSWITKINLQIAAGCFDRAADEIMAAGIGRADAQNLVKELTLDPDEVATRLQAALGKDSRISPHFVSAVNQALAQLRAPHTRLRFALIAFTEDTIRHFAPGKERFKHVRYRLDSTAAYFLSAGELIERFVSFLPNRISDTRRYVLHGAAQEKVITDRQTAGIKRFDKTASLPTAIGRHLIGFLTPEEKSETNAIGWFKEMFSVSENAWTALLRKYDLPQMDNVPKKTQDVFLSCRDKTISANAWTIMLNPRGYPFADGAISSMGQRAGSGKIEILHLLAAAGITVTPFCSEIREAVHRLFSQVPDILDLPAVVFDRQIDNLVAKIIHRQVAPRHWSIWVTKRAEILLRADEIIHNTGRLADRKKILLSLLSAHSHRVETIIEKFPSHP
ncbi:hypothetical protein A2482_01825 [Candidatus Falkowbacteria bacterium RIFOXYC2_FULL_48_21]|uniref:Uncharacterized protein n=1 Tax=Candidatus Falkowbacteria bacterium RIFOXYC2_FULL_48_21 TaxID=1798005 RepID=A0A1F5TFK6_9BACT|nr:MAG: hypothetical protein A2482_01825 [Candidatus Falkowbacteria bacterium RIFOXYC2_FULL_48_21]